MRIAFTGYAADCTISGEVELDSDRLKDQLDGDEHVVVHRAVLESLHDGRVICVPRMELDRDDLFAAEAVAPRGPRGRRIHTVRHAIVATCGPYRIEGLVHERPGARPMAAIQSGRPIVSVTDARVTFQSAGQPVRRHAVTLLVDSSRLEWVGDARAQGPHPAIPAYDFPTEMR